MVFIYKSGALDSDDENVTGDYGVTGRHLAKRKKSFAKLFRSSVALRIGYFTKLRCCRRACVRLP